MGMLDGLCLGTDPFHFRAAPGTSRLIVFGSTTHTIIAQRAGVASEKGGPRHTHFSHRPFSHIKA